MRESREPSGTDKLAASILAFILLGAGSGLAFYLTCKFAFGLEGAVVAAASIAGGLIIGLVAAYTRLGRAAGWVALELLYTIGLLN